MRVTERLNNFQKSQIRLSSVSLSDVRSLVIEYLQQRGWQILEGQFDGKENYHSMVAQSPINSVSSLFLNHHPQIWICSISQDGPNVQIETVFKNKSKFRLCLYSVLAFLFLSALIDLYLIMQGSYTWDSHISMFYVLSLLGVALLLTWLLASRHKHIEFQQHFYSRVYGLTGRRIEIVSDGSSLPDFHIILLITLVFVILSVPIIAQLYSKPFLSRFLLNGLVIVGIVAL